MTNQSKADFPAHLAALRLEVEACLDRLLPAPEHAPERLHEAMRYAVFAGGKRIRPALVVLSGELLGAPRQRLLPGAAALELIHTYSLVHDDLPALDDDDLRRGRPTVHRRYDEATAVLVGDALLTLGLTVLATEPGDLGAEERRAATALVGQAIGSLGMIGGQADDLAAEAAWPAEPAAALDRIHRRKTGALLAAAVRLGGLYAGAGGELAARLERFGEALGLMFQIADDILDVEGSSAELGKTAGKDAAHRKLTYPAVHGLVESHRRLAELAATAREEALGLPQGGGWLRALVDYLEDRRS
jgi:geranylgeranyl pyrophosphate synthase